MIELALIAVTTIGPIGGAGTVRGTILSDRDEPIVGVQIELPTENRVAWSDSAGGYEFGGLEPGEYEIRFSRFAYEPLRLTIKVPEGGALELDVKLKTRFVVQPGITVVTAGPGSRPPPFLSSGLPEVGSRDLPAEIIWSSPLVEQPDVLTTLRTVPGIDLAEESATQIHVRGGSADQNLVLLDGAPVYNGYHTSGILSAIPPDAVSRMVVHTGVLPARYGGRLSSVIDVETTVPSREGAKIRGGLGVPDARMATRTPLPGEAGEVLLAGRRTTYDLVRRGYSEGVEDSGFEDVLGKVSLLVLGGELRIIALHTHNWFSSFAGGGDGVEVTTDSELADFPDLHSSVEWASGTDAVAWSRTSERGSEIHLQVFRAATRSNIEWGSLSERHRMQSRLVHWGAVGDLDWSGATTVGRGGIAVEWLSSSYDTTSRAILDPEGSGTPGYSRAAGPMIVSSYLEHRWIPREHWMINSGLRVVDVENSGWGLEPRLSAHYRPTDGLTVSGGFGRAHQYVQSLANEESLLNTAYAVEPLLAAGSGGVPLARSDQLAAALEARLADRLLLTIDAYARWMDDIVLVAPTTAGPFATAGFERGQGSARGIGAELAYDGDRLDGRVVGELSSVRRTAAGVTYHPRFERRRALALEASYRLIGMATLTTAFQAASGLPTSLLQDGFDWEVFDQLTGEVEFSGTPVRAPGPLNAERLPPYLRLDLGVRREWQITGPGPDGTIAGYLNVMNVLDRENVLGRQLLASDSETRELHLLPRSVLFGIDWRF